MGLVSLSLLQLKRGAITKYHQQSAVYRADDGDGAGLGRAEREFMTDEDACPLA